MKKILLSIKEILYDDYINLYLISVTILFALTDSFIWQFILAKRELFVYQNLGIYPVQYLMVVLGINTFLGVFSYDKEKEISYLLLAANIAIGLLIFILEIFYLLNTR